MIIAPHGFYFQAVQAGFRYSGRNDLGLILSEQPAAAAGVFTTNRFQAAPVLVARKHLQAGSRARAIVVNAGQANACTGQAGTDLCRSTCDLVGKAFGLHPEDVLPASTGVIGESMDLGVWRLGVAALEGALEASDPLGVAKAMLTTDSFPKLLWREVDLAAGKVRLLGMAKGAGMICPNMATMLAFVTCDAQIEPERWQEMISRAAEVSFNRVSVDGDTSTNDCLLALANGASKVAPQGPELEQVQEALTDMCRELAYFIVQDAEGGTKVVRVQVTGARDQAQAEQAARTIAHSPLVKTAMFGRDPNWGRIIAALGRCGAEFAPDQVQVHMAGRLLFAQETPVQADVDSLLAPYLARQEIPIHVHLGQGEGEYEILTSDLTLDYVRINAEYRS